ncbi:MAG: cob(I)yrinic acid a,c-diamide adenosyltransferase [Clostridia bacterium]|nr:cob(I)yrinic acid a,c-diamide adenosyltransferase [Clostridia bacterium]
MIQSYFGGGKGKTSSAVGSIIRCLGSGKKVLFVQFLKNNDSSELEILRKLSGVDILVSEEPYHLFDNQKSERTGPLSRAYQRLLEQITTVISDYSLVVLDEILDVIDFGYLPEETLLTLLRQFKDWLEFILTGHKISPNIADISDYISEVKEVKHPYQKGMSPRKGFEY